VVRFAVAAAAAAASLLLSADLAGERAGREEFAALDLQGQHRKTSRCGSTDAFSTSRRFDCSDTVADPPESAFG